MCLHSRWNVSILCRKQLCPFGLIIPSATRAYVQRGCIRETERLQAPDWDELKTCELILVNAICYWGLNSACEALVNAYVICMCFPLFWHACDAICMLQSPMRSWTAAFGCWRDISSLISDGFLVLFPSFNLLQQWTCTKIGQKTTHIELSSSCLVQILLFSTSSDNCKRTISKLNYMHRAQLYSCFFPDE